MDFFIAAFNQYADFSGRATRQEYWMYVLFYFIFYIGAVVVDTLTGSFGLAALYSLVLLVPSLSIGARRLHDTGRSGWWQLLALIPLGVLVLIYFWVQESEADNDHGVKRLVAPE